MVGFYIFEFIVSMVAGWLIYRLLKPGLDSAKPRHGALIRLKGTSGGARCRFLRRRGIRWYITPPISTDRPGLLLEGELVIAEAPSEKGTLFYHAVVELADPKTGAYALRRS